MRLHCDKGVLQISFQRGKVVDFWALSRFSGTIKPKNLTLSNISVLVSLPTVLLMLPSASIKTTNYFILSPILQTSPAFISYL